jgi:hypothetical protein
MGVTGTQGSTGVSGSNGTTGLQGETGISGSNGSQGETGLSGSNGSTGLQGETGVSGSNGSHGETGLQGETGISGSNGSTGLQGETGISGLDGSQGATGVSGSNGSQGVTGLIGATGLQGSNGSDGAQGVTGLIGVTGSWSGNTGLFHQVGTTGLLALDIVSTSLTLKGQNITLNNGGVTGISGSIVYKYQGLGNVCPTLSGYTGVDGSWAYASTEFAPDTRWAWKAFNGTVLNNADAWTSNGVIPYLPQWLVIKLGSSQVITAYVINQLQIPPYSWILDCSDDGSSWSTIDTQTNVTTGWSSGVPRQFTCGSPSTAHQWYRITITSSQNAQYANIGDLQLLSPSTQVTLASLNFDPTLTSKWSCGGVTGPSEIITSAHAQSMTNKLSYSGVTGLFTGGLQAPLIKGTTGIFTGGIETPNTAIWNSGNNKCLAQKMTAGCTGLKSGHVVKPSTTIDGAMDFVTPTSYDAIGVIVSPGNIVNGADCWVGIAGQVQCYMSGGATGIRGDVFTTHSSTGATGCATIFTPPDPGSNEHWGEIGHCVKNYATAGGTGICILHFN